jgi:hypothetical protein
MKALVTTLVLCLLCASRAHAADGLGMPAPAGEPQQLLVLLKLPAPHYRPDGSYMAGYADTAGRATRRSLAMALARDNGLALATDWPMPILDVDCYVMDVPASLHVGEMAVRLVRDPRVAWAQPMNVFHPLGHDDPLFGAQPAAREWHLDEMHGSSTGRGVRVAIIDSKVQLDHPDLVGQVVRSAHFIGSRADPAESHGTAVAGVVAASADNHVGIAGVAPQARLLAMRACHQAPAADTVCTTLSLALAVHAAIDAGAQVINLSLSGPPDRLIDQLVGAALERGISVVAAADRTISNGGFPASVRGVLAVVDEAGGAVPAGMLAAPGSDVPATLPGSRWGVVSGASYAAAHVSGLLALMLEARGKTKRAASRVATEIVVTGDGRVDSCASLRRAGATCTCDCTATAGTAIPVTPP